MWFVLWMIVMLIFVALPLGYGWGYRRWGPPYPIHYERRRARENATMIVEEQANEWGVLGDIVWTVGAFGVLWLLIGLVG